MSGKELYVLRTGNDLNKSYVCDLSLICEITLKLKKESQNQIKAFKISVCTIFIEYLTIEKIEAFKPN